MLSKYKKVMVFNLNASAIEKAAQHGVHADCWILTAKLALFVALGFDRFVSESRPSSRR